MQKEGMIAYVEGAYIRCALMQHSSGTSLKLNFYVCVFLNIKHVRANVLTVKKLIYPLLDYQEILVNWQIDKGKAHPRKYHEGPEGEQRYSSTLS